jgi:hypothetical protein
MEKRWFGRRSCYGEGILTWSVISLVADVDLTLPTAATRHWIIPHRRELDGKWDDLPKPDPHHPIALSRSIPLCRREWLQCSFSMSSFVFTAVSTLGTPSWEEQTGGEHCVSEAARLAND